MNCGMQCIELLFLHMYNNTNVGYGIMVDMDAE